MDDRELLSGMENLGDNCEFGGVQKALGLETIGLFRWASTTVVGLERLFSEKLEHLDEWCELDTFAGVKNEVYLRNKRYEFFCHCSTHPGTDWMAHRKLEQRRLTLLKRKMLEDLRSGRKLLVMKSHNAPTEVEVRRLLAAAQTFGPNELLWVTEAKKRSEIGRARKLGGGLIHGTIDRFAPRDDALNVSLPAWLAMAREAQTLRAA